MELTGVRGGLPQTVPSTMTVAVARRYGGPDVVSLEDLPVPTPRRGDLLVKVMAAGVSAGDARIRGARFPTGFGLPARLAFGLRRPRQPVLGGTFSGVVVGLGPEADGFTVGQSVAGMTGARLGTHAQYAVVKAAATVPLPDGVSHVDAAGVLFGGSTALDYLRTKGSLAAGQRVLVVGAAGAVGTNAVQLAARAGAEVAGVCSARNADLVRELGAVSVIDHTVTDLAAHRERYDIVLDAVGVLSPADADRLLTPDGRLLLASASLGDTLKARGRVKAGPSPERAQDFAELLAMVTAGQLRVVIEATMPLAHIVAAHRRVDSGRKVGNIVVLPHPGT